MFRNSELFLEISKKLGGKYVLMYAANSLETTHDIMYEADTVQYYLHLNDQFNRWVSYNIYEFAQADSDYISQVFEATIFDSREDIIKYLKDNRDHLSIPTYQFGNAFYAVQIPTIEQFASGISKNTKGHYSVSSIMCELMLPADKEFDERIGLDQVWFNSKSQKN